MFGTVRPRWLWGVLTFAPILFATTALADPGIIIREIVVEEFGDPTFYCTFSVLIQPGTQLVGGGTDGFTVFFPPTFVPGTTGVPVGWQVAGTTANTAFYRPITGNVINVGLGQPVLEVGLFQFATFWPSNNYPPTLPVVSQVRNPGGTQQPPSTQDVPVRLIPEPASVLMFGLATPAVAALAWRSRWRKRRAA